MNDMHERVSLPDPDVQPMVHPLDVAQARTPYRTAWLLSLAASPEFLTLVGAFLWWATGGWMAPALAVVSTGVIAELARRHHAQEAWAHIPRRRQDVDRPDPATWAALRSLLCSAALVAGTLAVLRSLHVEGYDEGVRTYAVGTALGLGIALVATSAAGWWRTRQPVALAGAAVALGVVAAGVAVVALAGWLPTSPDVTTLVMGTVVILVIYAAWWLRTRTT